MKMCVALKAEEIAIKEKMDSHVQQVLAGKRIAVFKKLLLDIEHPDSKIADEMAEGFPLCGWLPSSGAFPTKLRAPEILRISCGRRQGPSPLDQLQPPQVRGAMRRTTGCGVLHWMKSRTVSLMGHTSLVTYQMDALCRHVLACNKRTS